MVPRKTVIPTPTPVTVASDQHRQEPIATTVYVTPPAQEYRHENMLGLQAAH